MILSSGYRTLSKLVKSTLVSLFDKATLSSMIPLLKNKLKLKQRQEAGDEICTHEGLNPEGPSSEEEGTRGSASSSYTQFSTQKTTKAKVSAISTSNAKPCPFQNSNCA